MPKPVTGYELFLIRGLWIKKGKPMDFDKFAEKVCQAKGWVYRKSKKDDEKIL